MRWWKRALGVGAAALWIGCGGAEEKAQPSGASMAAPTAALEERAAAPTGDNRAPEVFGLRLHPSSPRPGGNVEARFDVEDPDGDPVRITLTWLQNGRVFDEGSRRTWRLEEAQKGDEIEVRVTVSDGFGEPETWWTSVTVGNRAPVMRDVALQPAEPVPGDTIIAHPQGHDPDGDEIRFEIAWLLNGRPTGKTGPEFDTARLKRGDKVQAEGTAFDAEDEASAPYKSPELVIANSPPTIAELPVIRVEDGAFRYTLEAADPDGDRSLRFGLEEAPRGMQIDPVTGSVDWRPAAEDAGVHTVVATVSDSFGASSKARFELTVTAADDAPPAAAAD